MDEYRALALSMPEAVEQSHMGHPDFRVSKKIFATLWPDGETAVLKLTPEYQALLIEAAPNVFTPAKGAWGDRGMTQVHLLYAELEDLRVPMRAAWMNAAPKTLARQFRDEAGEG